jgi:cell division protein FtsL
MFRGGIKMTRVEKMISIAAGILGLVGAVVGVWAQVQTSKQQDIVIEQKATALRQQQAIAELDAEIKKLETDLKEREMNLTVSLKVYEKFEKIDYDEERDLRVATALLEILPHPEFKKKMADFVASLSSISNADGAAEIADVARFVADEAVAESGIAKKKSDTKENRNGNYEFSEIGWDYDVFWCAEPALSAQANPYRQKATAAVKIIKEKAQKPVGYVRLRELPVSVNQRSDYRIVGNVIQSDMKHDEVQVAEVIEAALNESEVFREDQVKHLVANGGSEWYISVFFCPKEISEG